MGELFNKENVESTQLLYDLSSCFKLGFMAANLAIVEATLDESDTKSDNNNRGNKIHVIDFDIGQGGGQYVYLLQALAARQNGKPFIVKITTVAADNSSQERLTKAGNALTQEAKKVGNQYPEEGNTYISILHKMKVELAPVKQMMIITKKQDRIKSNDSQTGELTRESLGCEPDESLVLNFAFKLYRVADESVSTDNPRDELLRRVKGLGPRVVILVEQEMNTNMAPFMVRVTETCSYYGALFDSFEATMSRDNSKQVNIEVGLSWKLANSVACEGRDRVERCEVFGKWQARMGMARFELKSLSQNVFETLKAKLSAVNRVNTGLTVTDQNGGVCIGWMGLTITVASAWR
uniref:Scarecrow-like protein 8 n=1 Tax=Quercus lobata TaxID=97700 RepID=A0A7N2MHY1_QUELO